MNIFLEMLFWFFAITGFVVLFYEVVRYFMYKNAMPTRMTILIPAESLGEDKRVGISNLINLLYEQNPHGDYDFIVLDDSKNSIVKQELCIIADAADCVFIANTENIAEYVKQSLL